MPHAGEIPPGETFGFDVTGLAPVGGCQPPMADMLLGSTFGASLGSDQTAATG